MNIACWCKLLKRMEGHYMYQYYYKYNHWYYTMRENIQHAPKLAKHHRDKRPVMTWVVDRSFDPIVVNPRRMMKVAKWTIYSIFEDIGKSVLVDIAGKVSYSTKFWLSESSCQECVEAIVERGLHILYIYCMHSRWLTHRSTRPIRSNLKRLCTGRRNLNWTLFIASAV